MLGWNGIAQHADISNHMILTLLEVIVVRVCVVPLFLRRTIRRMAEPDLDLMPSNLFAWVIASALIVLAFDFGDASAANSGAFALGVVGATVTIALLILSTNKSPAAQLVALLFMENALALFESLLPEPWPLPTHAALSAVYIGTVGVGCWLLGAHFLPEPTEIQEEHKEVL